MTSNDCGISLPSQTDIVLDPSPYSITANELNN